MLILSQTQISELIPAGLFVLFMITISFFLTKLLTKKQAKLIFLIPVITFFFTFLFLILALLSNDWGRLGYLLISGIFFLSFLSASISSLIIFLKKRKVKS
jgi:hypothetical protein